MLRMLINLSPLRLIKRQIIACCLWVLLLILLTCALVFGLSLYLAKNAGAQTLQQQPYDILLLVDNSNSMYEKYGLGSDPNLLRIEAARLFFTYLGVDNGGVVHRLGVIFFGGESHLVVPLTPLTDDARREELAQLIDNPPRLSWTNPQAALELAASTFAEDEHRPATQAIVMLTDGKPEWANEPMDSEKLDVQTRLKNIAESLSKQHIPLFIILLQNQATDSDPEIEHVYVPLWQQMAAMTTPGQFYLARKSADLLNIYHDIVVTLTGKQTDGIVLQTQVTTNTVKHITVESGLAQVTLVIRKSNPDIRSEIFQPNGHQIFTRQRGVQHGGQTGQTREEIWAISDPQPGVWRVRLNGEGRVTVWKDFYPATPTPTFTPSATPTPNPTSTAISTPENTNTPAPTSTAIPPPPATPTKTATATLKPTRRPTATQTPVATATTTPATENRGSFPFFAMVACLGFPLLGASAAGGGWLIFQHRQSRARLTGVLRPIEMAGGLTSAGDPLPLKVDLDALNSREYPLPPAKDTPPVVLAARCLPDGESATVLVVKPNTGTGDPPITVNHHPVRTEWILADGDLIKLGNYKFKYENLRQRAGNA